MPKKINLIPGMPTNLDKYLIGSDPVALVFDDLMSEVSDSKLVEKAFTNKRHHKSVSVILLIQNMFYGGRVMRTLHVNTQYLVLFQNKRDLNQFYYLARQIQPLNSKKLLSAYIDATNKPYSHFLIDLKNMTPDALRYRSNTLSDSFQIVYVITV